MRGLGLVAAALLAGCYDTSFGYDPRNDDPELPTATIGFLCTRFEGTTLAIENPIVVKGRVTTSDRSENFYRTFCIEADGAALEIMAGLDHLHNDYPEGCTVAVHLQGWVLGESHGVLQLGRRPSAGSGYPTDYIASQPALDRTVVRCDEPLQPPVPTLRTLGELTTAMCGTLVRIENLLYRPDEPTEGYWGGTRYFTDDEGAEIRTYVRTYADFAEKEIPAERCALTGILQRDGDRYLLKLRDENDCTPM